MSLTTVAIMSLSTGGCWGAAHDEELVGPYRLLAIDTPEDMNLCWSIPGSDGGCVGDGLPPSTVFAAGFDERYLVAAVHPRDFPNPPDRTVVNYYYVIRSADEREHLHYSGIRGPLDEATFQAEKSRLSLPEFSRVFDNLK